MILANIYTTATVAGLGFVSNDARTDSGSIAVSEALAAAKAGTVTDRTDDDTGEITCSAGHGFAQFDVVDVYWDGGRRYGMDVGVVAGNVVPVDSGTGDALPVLTTAMTMQVQRPINIDFVGNDMSVLAAICDQKACITLSDAGGIELVIDLAADRIALWDEDSMHANPLTGDTIVSGTISQGGVTAATLKLGIMYDSTP